MRAIIISIVEPVKPSPNPQPCLPCRRIPSKSLLGPAGEVVIVHNGREYRLRQTQNGKLILTA